MAVGRSDPQDDGDDEEIRCKNKHDRSNDIAGKCEIGHGQVALLHITG